MVALSRCLASVTLLAGAEGARVSRKRATDEAQSQNTKFIGGAPVVNYHAAYGGQASMSSLEETREEEWIVMLQAGATDEQVQSLCANSRNGCKMFGHPGQQGVPFVDIRGTEKDLEAVILSAKGAVKFAEPVQSIHMTPELPADQLASASWGLNRVGASGRSGNQGANTHIYVLDTGVRTTHQDFGSRATPAVDYTVGQPKVCNGDFDCAADRQGHGTHCAGSAGGNSFGVAPKSNVYGVKVLGDNGSGGFDAIVGAIDYMATSGARPAIGSMSLGGQCPFGWCGLLGSVKTAVDTAVDAGVTIVVAGGNSNSDACGFVPAFVPSAITVGSTDSTDARSFFSNYGSCTNIWAPGSDITSAAHTSDTGSATFSGTSMACPHVAGGAALQLERNPEFKAPQVLEKLLAKAATNYITDLKRGDVNKLLYVAADAPPPPGGVQSADTEGPGIQIINGTNAKECQFKYQVQLQRSGQHWCGGTLVAPGWVLSAAHCFKGFSTSSFKAVAGQYDARVKSSNEQSSNLAQVYNHPRYNSRTSANDIALLKLSSPFKLNKCVGLASLPRSDVSPGTTCVISGWGSTRVGGSGARILQQAPVTVYSQKECKNSGYSSSQITDDMLCAQGRRDGKITDACQGDSGGPLVCSGVVYGATSWGRGCGGKNYPGVWSRVHYFKSWIAGIMG